MTYINLPDAQQHAISEVKVGALQAAADRCVNDECVGPIYDIELSECGPYISSKLQLFRQAISEHAKAKAHSKRERTRADALRAGSALMNAVREMKGRVETERQERQLFYVDDLIRPPIPLRKQLSVTIPFSWRPSVTSEWKSGRTTFVYDFAPPLDYAQLPPTRKPSAAKSARDLEDRLYQEWKDLKMRALGSLRDFLRKGGDGDTVPEVFAVQPEANGGGLNNFSCNFWQSR